MSDPWTGQWVDFDPELALLRSDYDDTAYPLPEPARGTRGPGELVTEPWEDEAACLGQTDTMYPHIYNGLGAWQKAALIAAAKAVCANCPVTAQCRAEVETMTPGELDTRHVGVWIRAGKTNAELRAERRGVAA